MDNQPEEFVGAVEPAIVAPDWGTREGMALAATGRHPGTIHLARYFAFAHLAGPLRGISEPFAHFAETLIESLPDGPELTTALRKLLEAKDCAVRARVDALDA